MGNVEVVVLFVEGAHKTTYSVNSGGAMLCRQVLEEGHPAVHERESDLPARRS